MTSGLKEKESKRKLPAPPWGELPPRMRVLFITGTLRTGQWLADAFAADGACDVSLERAVGIAAGLAHLRDEVFDAVLLSHEGDGLDALELLATVRTGSRENQPIIVLGCQSEEEMTAPCHEAGADAYVCVNTTTLRTLIWKIALARERHQLIAENRRLRLAQRQHLQMEHDEAGRLLRQQREMLHDLEAIYAERHDVRPASREGEFEPLPERLIRHYRDLLRAYVIMGSGNLGEDMARLTELFLATHMSAQQVMRLHLGVLEEMIEGLGNRSARHVMNRADMLVLEVMLNLAEGYRERYFQRVHPPRQRWLPGF